jgi:hypothetical protein
LKLPSSSKHWFAETRQVSNPQDFTRVGAADARRA